MAEPWNFTPTQWSEVLSGQETAATAADKLKAGNFLPWTSKLFELTADVREILDLGSGRGENAAALALKGKKTTLLDWSQENLDFSSGLYETLSLKGTFQRADMTQKLPFADGSFDVVYSCGVFEYFNDQVIRGILKEAFRVARKRVIVMVPNALCVPYRAGMKYLQIKNKWPWGGERPFVSLKSQFASADNGPFREYSVGFRHSLDFLVFPGGGKIRRALTALMDLKHHSKPAFLRQGYLLIAEGDKR